MLRFDRYVMDGAGGDATFFGFDDLAHNMTGSPEYRNEVLAWAMDAVQTNNADACLAIGRDLWRTYVCPALRVQSV